ncbi:tetratricopeptide repeat protein [Congregibacter sp.]|uniref:tetratricopeptide repeat protein n=1 Tax=Congregibacter sp. TaxID=2744308 RepID=UPI003F6AC77A
MELERSVRLDPNYAPARAQLAIGIALLAATSGTYGDLSIDEVNERAGEQLAAAEAIDDNFAELWAARAILARINFDDQEYLRNSELALAIRPNYADPLNWRVNALNGLGMAVQAVEAREELLRLDPLTVVGRLNAVTFIANAGEPERALGIARSIAPQSPWASHVAQSRAYRGEGKIHLQLEQLLLAYSLDSRDLLVNFEISEVFVNSGLLDEALRIDRTVRPWVLLGALRFEEAEQAFRQAVAADPESLENISSLATSIYLQGRFAEAVELWQQAAAEQLQVLKALSASVGEAGFTAFRWWHFNVALIAALENDKQAALQALQAAESAGLDYPIVFLEPIFDGIRDEPAFEIVRQNVASRAVENREKVLTLICENNPVPDHWRPLAATCLDL